MDFSTPKFVTTNGIRMEYYEQGQGPVVLLLHGFPELPFSWRHVVDPIIAAGFRVIVPSLRGFGGTDAPEGPAGYNVRNVVADITGLLDALGIKEAVWFGHDAGAFPAWYAGLYAPDRVIAHGAIGVPYAPDGDVDMVQAFDELRGPNQYMRTFQEPGVAEAVLERDVEHTFRSLMRGRGYTIDEFEAAPREIQELPIGFFVGEPQLFGAPIVTDEELQYYVQTYERTGFTGGLNWYRALHEDHEEARGVDYVIDKPALMINAADDWLFPRGSTAGMPALLPKLEEFTIGDAAHWLQQEKPQEVTAILLGWLQRTFMNMARASM